MYLWFDLPGSGWPCWWRIYICIYTLLMAYIYVYIPIYICIWPYTHLYIRLPLIWSSSACMALLIASALSMSFASRATNCLHRFEFIVYYMYTHKHSYLYTNIFYIYAYICAYIYVSQFSSCLWLPWPPIAYACLYDFIFVYIYVYVYIYTYMF
jgi:hypothetical protein